jgi:oxygen-dependent protoporphyrinogen oxidase
VFVPRASSDSDESLGSFVRRRLGSELLNKIAGPLMAGIHAGDPERLSLRSTFPMFAEMEKTDRSLVLGMMKRKRVKASGPETIQAPSMFTTLAGGLQQLPDAIAARLDGRHVKLNCGVQSLLHQDGEYKVILSDGSSMRADNIIFATPAYVTAEIIRQLDPSLAETLRAIRYVSTATVSLGFKRSELTCSLKGLGFIVPASERRRINACSWSSLKFSNRAPEECVLMRVFVGGALAEDLAQLDEAALIDLARRELHDILGITAAPILARAYRWNKSNPQYEVGHGALIAQVERLTDVHPGLYLVGAAYRGSGVPDCIQSGRDAAMKITQLQDAFQSSRPSVALPVPVAI